jgi:hypothetical protein
VVGVIAVPHATVVFESGVITGNVAGLTVIVRVTGVKILLHSSVAVQVSVMFPPQAPGRVDNVDAFEVPEIWQLPERPLLNGSVLAAGSPLHATVISDGAVIVGNVAGRTVIVLLTETNGLLHASVAVQVSVAIPPQAPGIINNPGTVHNVEGFEVPDILQLPSLLLLN